jgi:hypothetical protein
MDDKPVLNRVQNQNQEKRVEAHRQSMQLFQTSMRSLPGRLT